MEQLSGKTKLQVLAALLLWNSILCLSNNPVTPEFRIYGRNGYCAHAYNYVDMVLFTCGHYPQAESFSFYSDATLRLDLLNDKCITSNTFTEGSQLVVTKCTTPPTNATLWKLLPGDRQIMHQSTGLVLSAIIGLNLTHLTLEKNIYSACQTWRLKLGEAVSTAHIIGMNDLCLHLSLNTQVWLGECGSLGTSGQDWLIYPDATIRPRNNPSRCLSFNNLVDLKVLVTSCGLSLTSERWLFTNKGTILNEHTNLVLDVSAADPSHKTIIVYSSNGRPNQQWRPVYI